MYSSLPSFVLGFHGCDKQVGEKVLAGKDRLNPSQNDYDWLGNGIYFWENNPNRALDYAKELKKYPQRVKSIIKTPFVIGAIIDLGCCLNLLDARFIDVVKTGYKLLQQTLKKSNVEMPKNKHIGTSRELLLRNLDCAVIQMVHQVDTTQKYDTVRGVFTEGTPLYENSGFQEKSHIQICVVNPNCIKGYFYPLDPIAAFPIP